MNQPVDKMEREILAIHRRDLFRYCGYFNGFITERSIASVIDDHAVWMKRGEAEINPNYKQIIPYLLVCNESRDSYLRYKRSKAGGEGRLHDKYSIGFGGHIEIEDSVNGMANDLTVLEAARREFKEELKVNSVDNDPRDIAWTQEILGLLNLDYTEVDQVHVGVVMRFSVSDLPALYAGDAEIASMDIMTPYQLWLSREENYEAWSKKLIEVLRFDHGGPLEKFGQK